MDKYIGKLLDGRYELVEILGVGGMAVVYRARDTILNRFVAIKIMKDEFTNDEEFRRRFRNESQAAAQLSHSNIVQVFDVSPPNSQMQYIVMELIEGITLKDYLLRKGRLSWQETLFFAQQISKALAYVHSHGVIHQDIKPHNIILLRDGTVKVTDFGIARFEQNQETRVIQEAIGSVHYISPEQAQSSRIDHRADLYSLGVVMYEMLTGTVPFDGDTPLAIVMKHINAQAPLPSEVVLGTPRGMDDIVMHAMCPKLEERYGSATEIYNDLETLKKDPTARFWKGLLETPPPPPPPQSQPVGDETIAMPRVTNSSAAGYEPYEPEDGYADDYEDEVQRPQKSQQRASAQRSQQKSSQQRSSGGQRPRKKKKRALTDSPAAMAGIAVAIFVLIALGVSVVMMRAGSLFGGGKKVEVPALIGMQYTEAQNKYTGQFRIVEGERRQSLTAQEGEILDQSPKSGTKTEKGGLITVVVCAPPETKPEDKVITINQMFIGANYQYVESELKDLGLFVEIEREASMEVEKDKVIRTDPALDSQFHEGDHIILYVSDGAEDLEVPVPGLVGKSYEDAKALLTDSMLTVSSTREYNNDYPEGQVFKQSIDEGTSVKVGTEVLLYISNGPEKKPEPEPEPNEPEPDHGGGDPELSGHGSSNDPEPDKETTANVSIELPTGNRSVVLVVEMNGTVVSANQTYDPEVENPVNISISGPAGTTQTIDIYINGAHERRSVTFPES